MRRTLPLLLAMALLLAGCGGTSQVPVAKLPVISTQGENQTLDQVHLLEGGKIRLTTSFASPDIGNWRITDPKTLTVTAKLEFSPVLTDTRVYIDNVHVDVSLRSTQPQLDGWDQDSADFHLHTGGLIGVPLLPKYGYEDSMSIQGFSQTLMTGWGYYSRGSGYTEQEQNKLSEEDLVKRGGVYANQVQIVWRLLVLHQGETEPHQLVARDSFLVEAITYREAQQQPVPASQLAPTVAPIQ